MPDSASLNPPKIAIRIANILFVLGGFFSVLISAYAIYRIFSPIFSEYMWVRNFYLIATAVGVISAILFFLGLRLKENVRVNLSLLFLSIAITVYGVETYLEYSLEVQNEMFVDIENIQLFSDNRTRAEVISDLKKDGVEVYPNVNPTWELLDILTKEGLTTKEGKLFALSGISNKMMVQENENGYWMMYVGDRYGFHNPDNVYDVNTVDIVMTGDSFTEGWAVRSDENISAVLRTFDWNVVNFGKAGNGPLLEYATLKEYAQILKPKVVLWLYWINDFYDLSYELRSTLLTRYLNEDEFSQNLLSRQVEIDNALIQFVEGKTVEQVGPKESIYKPQSMEWIQGTEEKNRLEFASKPIVKILKLRNLRMILKLVPEPIEPEVENDRYYTPATLINFDKDYQSSIPPTSLKTVFRRVIEKGDQLVSSWNGRLYFVYLPQLSVTRDDDNMLREFVLDTATELGLPVIDIQNDVFASHPDPSSLYPFHNSGYHYNSEGYRLVAEAIAARLRADGVLQ